MKKCIEKVIQTVCIAMLIVLLVPALSAYAKEKDYIVLKEYPKTLYVGDYAAISFTMYSYYNDFSYTFSSSDPTVIKVNSDETIVAVGAGTADIIIRTSHAEKRVPVTVKEVFAEHLDLRLYPQSRRVQIGKTVEIEIRIFPVNTTDKKIYFSSSDNSIATVTANGIIKGISSGKATITAATSNGISTTVEIEVFEIVPSEIICEDAVRLKVDESCDFPVKIRPSNANNQKYDFTYDDEFLQYSGSELKAVKEGETSLHIETWNGIKKDIPVIIDSIPVESIKIKDSTKYICSHMIDRSAEILLVPEIVPDNATYQDVTWSSSDENIISVEDRKFQINGTGKVTLLCSAAGGATNSVEFVVIDIFQILICVILVVAGTAVIVAAIVKERNSNASLD